MTISILNAGGVCIDLISSVSVKDVIIGTVNPHYNAMTNDNLIDLLQSHRLSYTFEQDGETGLSLLDRLTPEGDSDVSRGKDEIQFLAEEIELFNQSEHPRAWNDAIDEAIESVIDMHDRSMNDDYRLAYKLVESTIRRLKR